MNFKLVSAGQANVYYTDRLSKELKLPHTFYSSMVDIYERVVQWRALNRLAIYHGHFSLRDESFYWLVSSINEWYMGAD